MKKRYPIGISDFRKIIEEDYYYVDKSLLIKDLIESGSETILFPRPRRFGKTLGLSMLRYFFEKTEEDTSKLFRHLDIWKQDEVFRKEQGRYPVIYLTFKDVKNLDWESCLVKLKRVIADEFGRHQGSIMPHLSSFEQQEYQNIVELKADLPAYEDSLRKLSVLLERCHGRKTVILIDEYDTPIQHGFLHHYYDEVISFSRNLLSGALKDNTSLERGILTGILRVAKESIFSGLNHIQVCSLLTPAYSTYFGLTESEVSTLLQPDEVDTNLEEVRDWYNGYVFGGNTIYNPWSIINYADSRKMDFSLIG